MDDDKFGPFWAGYFLGGCRSGRREELWPAHPIRSGVIAVLAALLLVHCIDMAFPNARKARDRQAKPPHLEKIHHAIHSTH
jgi:hypothetical protein